MAFVITMHCLKYALRRFNTVWQITDIFLHVNNVKWLSTLVNKLLQCSVLIFQMLMVYGEELCQAVLTGNTIMQILLNTNCNRV